jgi:xylan 1,4-beta-xylosidase
MEKAVQVTVDASDWDGILPHTWNYIGYDECNYTHSPGGMELLSKIGKLEKPYYVRVHHLLCTGICHGIYKWGSTNVYLEDENANPIYNFEVIDRMCDIWLMNNCKPFFEIGFMPMDMVDLSDIKVRDSQFYNEYKRIGYRRPPKDYNKWYDLIRVLVEHLLDRYGLNELETWYFELWNEPDGLFAGGGYWSGTHEEFCKLYDYTEAAIHDIAPSLKVGGPATHGSLEENDSPAVFLRDFLNHCKSGINFKTGKIGTRIDFTTFHTKGNRYTFATNRKRGQLPSVKVLLGQIKRSGNIVKECGYGDLECILSEADPDGWAAGGRFDNPTYEFRNTEYYASYVASTYKNIYDLAAEMKMDIRPLAWAFMFEGERCFEGTRTFSTQGIDKAVLNVFRLFSKLGSQRISLKSSRDLNPQKYNDNWGEGQGAEIDGWATLTGVKSIEILIYCHQDTWETETIYPVEFEAERLPFGGPYKIIHYRVDKNHSNAYTEWLRQGSPDYPAGEQYAAIKTRDGLELITPVLTVPSIDGKVKLSFDMPVKSVSLIVIEQA